MSQFPQALYRAPGVEKTDLGMFTTALVANEDQREAHLANGWHESQEGALAEAEKAAAQPTRAELEQRATELGLKFDGRTTDAKLAAAIEAKLKDAA